MVNTINLLINLFNFKRKNEPKIKIEIKDKSEVFKEEETKYPLINLDLFSNKGLLQVVGDEGQGEHPSPDS